MSITKWIQSLPLVFILLLALFLRLYRVNQTVLDWHSFRQADTASVTREYVKNGIDVLRPRYHDLSNIQSGQNNPEGYRMVEFPIIQASLALILKAAPWADLVTLSRLAAITASLGTVAAIYYLGLLWSGKKVGAFAALTFAVLPYSVFYSRAVLPEPFMLAASTGALVFWNYWLTKHRWQYYWLAFGLFSLALLLKPFVAFLLPVFIASSTIRSIWRKPFDILALFFFSLTVVPLLLWRWWIMQFPTGIPAADWLLNGNGIRLRPAWFRWLGYERLTKMILGYIGPIFILFSLIRTKFSERILYSSWWLGILAYLIVVASGNVQHDYYQNLLLPIICLTVARGMVMLVWLLKHKLKIKQPWFAVTFLYLVMLVLAWYQVKGFYQMNHSEYVKAGQVVDQQTPSDALVIAPAFGDTQFLFQTNRRGWPIGFEIDKKISLGAQYYITTSYDDEARELEKKYFTIVKTQDYLLLDLQKPTTTKP